MKFLKAHKSIIIYIVTVLCSVAFVVGGYLLCKPAETLQNPNDIGMYTATVLSIDNVETSSYSLGGENEIAEKRIEFTARITSGDTLKGLEITAYQALDELLPINPKEVEVGNSVLLNYMETGDGSGDSTWNFMEYHRSDGLIWLCAFFFLILLVFGRKKGFNTIVSLVFTCLAVFAVFVPSILKGYNIYLSASIVSVFIVFMTLLIVDGANKKTFCAILGNLGGLAVAGVLTVVMDNLLHLTGVVDEQSIFLVLLNEANPIDLRAIIFGAIIIGALGATMDVAMSIASALHELAENMKEKSFKNMLKSGFNIGRDAMSTMTNTLVLAYIGSSLSIVLLLVANNQSLLTLFNREMIIVEILQALVGSIGILCTIPITSLLAAYVYNRKKSIMTPQEGQNNLETENTISTE